MAPHYPAARLARLYSGKVSAATAWPKPPGRARGQPTPSRREDPHATRHGRGRRPGPTAAWKRRGPAARRRGGSASWCRAPCRCGPWIQDHAEEFGSALAVADRRAHVSVGRDHPRPRPLLTVSIALSRRRTVRHIDPENFRSLTPINYGHFTQRERSSVRLEGQQICSEAYTKSTAGKEIIMSFMLVFLIPVAALFGGAVVYDLTRRRRHGPRHDVTSAARKARSDAESHGSP